MSEFHEIIAANPQWDKAHSAIIAHDERGWYLIIYDDAHHVDLELDGKLVREYLTPMLECFGRLNA